LDIRLTYKDQIRRHHQSAIVRMYFNWYAEFWYHTQLWLPPIERRPYTFIFRDWIFPHMGWFFFFTGIWYAGMIAWLIYSVLLQNMASAIACLVISTLSGFVWAHLRWGATWVPGEQENPPYIGD
jgi:hypothetical protein